MITFLAFLALQHPEPSTTFTFSAIDAYRLPTSLDGADGDVALTHAKASGELFHKFGPTDFLRILGGGDALHYDWSGSASGLPEDLQILRLEATYFHAYDDRWTGVAHVSSSFHFEEGADALDGGAYGVGLGALYRFGPELTLGALLRVLTRVDDRPYVLLLPYFDWKPSPAWTIRLEQREGLGVEATHGVEWALQARLIYNERRFRLKEDAIRPEGIFEDARFTVTAGVRWQPSPRLSASLFLGLDLRQEFTLEADGGRRGAEFESEPGPLVGFNLSCMF